MLEFSYQNKVSGKQNLYRKSMTQLHQKKPITFHSKLEVSTVFMEWEDKILLLQRASHKVAPGTWGIPGGKLEGTESPLNGLLREIKEELQLTPSLEKIYYIGKLYAENSIVQYKLHLFRWRLECVPRITLNKEEHAAFIWQPIAELNDLPLLEGQLEAFSFAYNM